MDVFFLNEIGDATGQYACFSTAGASQNEQRSFDVTGCFALLGIELFEDFHRFIKREENTCYSVLYVYCRNRTEMASVIMGESGTDEEKR